MPFLLFVYTGSMRAGLFKLRSWVTDLMARLLTQPEQVFLAWAQDL